MKILVTGANGFLGVHLLLYLSKQGFTVIACSRGINRISATQDFPYYTIDLTDALAVNQLIDEIQPDVIIHTAANSKPDECEQDKAACILQNVTATENLLAACAGTQTHFIFTSTDFIFGENGPHNEDDTPNPLNFYGQSKLMAEQKIKESGLLYTIVRPVFIYGPVLEGMRPSFLHWVKNNLAQQKTIKVVSDQQRTPGFVVDICRGIETIIRKKANGVFHLAGKDIVSPYNMAMAVAKVLGLDAALIEKVTSDTFKETVIRAKQSGVFIDKARDILGYHPVSFEEGVQLTFNQA